MELDRWFRLTLVVLAAWRLTHLLGREDGPWDIFANLRLWLGNSFLGKLMDCFYCLSIWVAAPAACLLTARWKEWPLYWVAISGAVCLLERTQSEPVIMRPIPPGQE